MTTRCSGSSHCPTDRSECLYSSRHLHLAVDPLHPKSPQSLWHQDLVTIKESRKGFTSYSCTWQALSQSSHLLPGDPNIYSNSGKQMLSVDWIAILHQVSQLVTSTSLFSFHPYSCLHGLPCIFSTCPLPPTKSILHSKPSLLSLLDLMPWNSPSSISDSPGPFALSLCLLLPSAPVLFCQCPPPAPCSPCPRIGCEFYNCFFLSHLGGVHRQRSCCSEMWRQLLRDSETSVPGPRGKKGSEKGREEGERGRERKGGKDLTAATNPGGSSLSTKLSFWKKHSDSMNFLLSILPRIPFSGKRRGSARGPQDRKPPRMQPRQPGAMEERLGEETSLGGNLFSWSRKQGFQHEGGSPCLPQIDGCVLGTE